MLPPSQLDRVNLIKGIDTESWESVLRDVIIKRNVSVKACLSIRLISFRECVAKEEDGVPTRMHSSTMSTVRCSGCLSCHACPATPTPRHARPLHLTYTLHHTCPPLPRVLPFTMHAPSLWTEFSTHACENITFP